MANEQTIVSGMTGRYAQALYDLAWDQRATDKVAADLAAFGSIVAQNADLQRLVRSPVFTADQQVGALDGILSKMEISGLAANFIKLTAVKRRLFAVESMIADFRKLYDSARGVTRARVTVAQPLSAEHLETLKTALAEISGGKSVDVDVKIDPAIIGGLVVQLGSSMVDGSLRTKLNAIRTKMKEVG